MARIAKATILMGFMLLAWKLRASFINKSVLSTRVFFSPILFQLEWSSNIEHNYNGFIINIFVMTFQLEYWRQRLFSLSSFGCTIVVVVCVSYIVCLGLCACMRIYDRAKNHIMFDFMSISILAPHIPIYLINKLRYTLRIQSKSQMCSCVWMSACVFDYGIWFENTIWLYFINPCAEAIGFKFSLQCLSIGLDEIRQDKNVVEQKFSTGNAQRMYLREWTRPTLHTRLEDTQTNKHTHMGLFVRNIATDLNVMKYKRCHLILDAR